MIVVTNPPFSLFREYLTTLIDHSKRFIIGNVNAIKYEEVFPLFMNNRKWLGASIHSGDRAFYVPDDYPLDAAACGVDSETGRKYIRVKGVIWFTNLDIKQRHEEMILVKHNNPDYYPKYINYDAIEVSKTADIPCDYSGEMGVPITFKINTANSGGCHEKNNIHSFIVHSAAWDRASCGERRE